MFKEKDLDTDGAMSYEEFIGHDTKMALAFKAIDKNGDGYLSKYRQSYKNLFSLLLTG